MDSSKVLSIVLAIAITILATLMVLFHDSGKQHLISPVNDSCIDVILNRTSIREYQDKPVEEEKIELLLRAAMAAPTAANKQPWAFIVVNDKDVLIRLSDSLPYAKMTAKAPLAIAVCGDMSKALEGDAQPYWVQDASAATQNLLLAAHALGLGAVWTGVYPIMDRVAAVQKIFNLPEHIIPLNVIPIGYPVKDQKPKDKWKPENIHYNGW
ncbi:MAG: nitroreductase family protein [Bacteroidales bacterium]|nr:nitroreductase family protein [Bacteroidales bacterium]